MKPGTFTSGHASCKLRYSQAVPAHLRGRLMELTKLHTPEQHRGKGHAAKLLHDAMASVETPDAKRIATGDHAFGCDADQ